MNVFWLDERPWLSARYYDDTRVNKGLTEAVQLVSSALQRAGETHPDMYDPYNIHNDIVGWAATSKAHLYRVTAVCRSLDREYRHRWDNSDHHGAMQTLRKFVHLIDDVPYNGYEDPPLYMPDEYKGDDVVAAYRRYFAYDKGDSAVYRHRPIPPWWPDDAPRPETGDRGADG